MTEATEDEAAPLEITSATPAPQDSYEEESSNVSSDDRQTVVIGPPEAHKSCIPLVVSAASKWRAAAEMGDQAANPNWRRAAVRAVQLQVIK